jgi:alkylation response protein AidB-like acyl-CoA dehydrogenase
MDFSLSHEHIQLRDLVRRFCQTEIAPLVQEAEETETFPTQIFRKWGDLGLFGIRYPEADGGSGLDKVRRRQDRGERGGSAQDHRAGPDPNRGAGAGRHCRCRRP